MIFPHYPGDVASPDCQWNAPAAAAGSSRPAQFGLRHGRLDELINQSINQREICRAPLYETSRSANSSQWYARSKNTLLSRFLNVLVSVMWWRSEGRVFQAAGPQ